jgi:predicted DNA-binding protein YlxM (UPF0122 family)
MSTDNETVKADQNVITLPLTTLDFPEKVKLTVPLIATYLTRGYPQTQIAKICNVSKQAVNDYIDRHYDELGPLVGNDTYLAVKCRHTADKALNIIHEVLDDCTKKDLIALNAVAGTQIDKYRLLSGQSTQNIDYHDSSSKMSALDQEIDKLKQELGMSDDVIDITPVKPVKVESNKPNQDTIKDNNE